jgi:rRNA pseudouridine-1189 N-methylase Emg1 (Nep1/Mra1 family)
VAVITTKELTTIDDELNKEQNLIAKFKNYADTTSDMTLKNQYEAIAQKHQKHFDTLYNLLK